MFTPEYSISDRLLNALVKLEGDRTYVATAAVAGIIKAKLDKRNRSTNLLYIANTLGANISLKDCERFVETRKLDASGDVLKLMLNFRNILEFNRSAVAETYAEIDMSLVTHLNKLLLNEWREPWEAKLRAVAESPDAAYDNWLFDMRGSTEGASSLQQELTELIDWYKAANGRIATMIRIAIFMLRFWELSPFLYGNKLTGLAVLDYLLVRHGYSRNSYLPSFRTFVIAQDDYLEAKSYVQERKDMAIWIERFVRNLAQDMQDTKDEFVHLQSNQEEANKQPFLDLNKRQLKILKYLQTIPNVRREDYCQMMDVSTMTAFRDLSDLVDKKLLRIEGQGRGTKYMLYSR